VCHRSLPLLLLEAIWFEKIGQIIRRGRSTWLVCIVGPDPEYRSPASRLQ
jgi:hypothetical protein